MKAEKNSLKAINELQQIPPHEPFFSIPFSFFVTELRHIVSLTLYNVFSLLNGFRVWSRYFSFLRKNWLNDPSLFIDLMFLLVKHCIWIFIILFNTFKMFYLKNFFHSHYHLNFFHLYYAFPLNNWFSLLFVIILLNWRL